MSATEKPNAYAKLQHSQSLIHSHFAFIPATICLSFYLFLCRFLLELN